MTHVTTSGLVSEGVRLVGPSDAGFDDLIEALAAPGWVQTIRESAPSVVVVANDTRRKIVAMSTRFRVVGGEHQGDHSVFFAAPDAIAAGDLDYGRASSKGIAPGTRHMIGFDFEVPDRTYYDKFTKDEADFYDPQVRNWLTSCGQSLASARAIHVTFDAVIFDDGGLLGEATDALALHFDALVQARQRLYRTVLAQLVRGADVDAVVRGLWSPDEPDVAEWDTAWHAANEARNTIAFLQTIHGGDALAGVLRRAILPEPFAIHRQTAV
jgi:hypothetical protein